MDYLHRFQGITCYLRVQKLVVFIFPILLSGYVVADTEAKNSYLDDFSLEYLLDLEVTSVSSNFLETKLQTGSSVDLITREDWEKTSSRKLMEALEHLPSVMINVSTFGTTSAMHFRGIVNSPGTRGVAFLLDGVPINNAVHATALYSAQQLGLGILDRVEIIRGAGSAIHGNDAFQGVVSLHSRSFDYDTVDLYAGTGDGGYNFARFGLAKSTSDRLTLSLSGDVYDIDDSDAFTINYGDPDPINNEIRTKIYEHPSPLNKSMSVSPKITFNNGTVKVEASVIHSRQERSTAITTGSFFGLVRLDKGESELNLKRLSTRIKLTNDQEFTGLIYHYRDRYLYPTVIDPDDTSFTGFLVLAQVNSRGDPLFYFDYLNTRVGFDFRFLQHPTSFFELGKIQWAAALSGSQSENKHAVSDIDRITPIDGNDFDRDLISVYAESKIISKNEKWEIQNDKSENSSKIIHFVKFIYSQ